MLGFIESEYGSYLVEGMTLEDIDVRHYRQQIATVLQDLVKDSSQHNP